MISSKELEVKARTCLDILRVVLGPSAKYCPCEASEQNLGQKPNAHEPLISSLIIKYL